MPDDLPIEQLGKGAVPQPQDDRDYEFDIIAAVSPPIDWTHEFRLPEPPNENQNGSLSCTSQAVSYYHWQLRGKNYSRRDIYAQIYLAGGGAYGRDAVKFVKEKGQATRDETPDPSPQTETAMRDKTGISAAAEASDIEADYFLMSTGGIEGIAIAVRDHKGCVFGVHGNNSGWSDKTNPKPPTLSTREWAHYIYAFGYHTHSGQKCIIAKSSWCSGSHHEHHIKENYFTSNQTFDRWVIVAKDHMNIVIYKNGSEYQIAHKAKSEEGFAQQLFDAGAHHLLTPEGKPNFAEIDKIAHVL